MEKSYTKLLVTFVICKNTHSKQSIQCCRILHFAPVDVVSAVDFDEPLERLVAGRGVGDHVLQALGRCQESRPRVDGINRAWLLFTDKIGRIFAVWTILLGHLVTNHINSLHFCTIFLHIEIIIIISIIFV
jgi:hypothetical protein